MYVMYVWNVGLCDVRDVVYVMHARTYAMSFLDVFTYVMRLMYACMYLCNVCMCECNVCINVYMCVIHVKVMYAMYVMYACMFACIYVM